MVLFGDFDIALLALYAFWIFFFCLIVYLQRENSREGYPLEDEATGRRNIGARFGQPREKVFKLAHGLGERVLGRDGNPDERPVEGDPVERSLGTAYEPRGNPMLSGMGAGAWAERPDRPDLNAHGKPKIVPLRAADGFGWADVDMTGWPVFGADGKQAGTIRDVWVDSGEQVIRYAEVEAPAGPRLVPFTAMIVDRWTRRVSVHSLMADQFEGIPTVSADDRITMLEEEKVMAYVAAGKLFAHEDRREALL